MKILRVLFLLLVFPVPVLMADLHLSVDVNDPAYMILEMAEIKGAIYSLSRVKPYTAETIYSLLSRAQSKQGLFSADESAILGRIIQDLEERFPGLPGNPAATDPVQLNPVYPGPVRLGFWEESLFQINANNPKNWHMYNALRFFMAGDVGDFLSWYGNVGFTYDKVGPDSFAPYSFTKEWDGFHIGFGEPRYSMDGVEPIPYLSFILENEITAEFFENSLTFKFARYRRDWSIGDGSLLLSKTARPFEGFDFSARLADWISLSYTVGSLGNWMEENQIDSDDDLSSQKMFTAQILEFFPFTWLSFSAASSAVWGKRFELGYLSPLMYPLLHQNLHGDMDNVMLELKAEAFLPGYAKFYFCFFADEMELASMDEFFKRPRSMVAIQAGTRVLIPWLPFTMFTFQYTKIEPFVYAHYPENRISSSRYDVDMSYTHDGENLGYALPPNSDEFLAKLDTVFTNGIQASLSYRLIRHGTNTYNPAIPLIYGDVNAWFDYDMVDAYPDKRFLSDGYYDWNNVITISGTWKIPGTPVTVSLSYSFCHTFWDMNETGVAQIDTQLKNIFSVRVRVF